MDSTYRDLAAAVLVAHQRRDSQHCLCGWGDLGRSHAEHVAGVLEAAGALRAQPRPAAPTELTARLPYRLREE